MSTAIVTQQTEIIFIFGQPLTYSRGTSVFGLYGAQRPVLNGYMRVSKVDGSQALDLQRDACSATVFLPASFMGLTRPASGTIGTG